MAELIGVLGTVMPFLVAITAIVMYFRYKSASLAAKIGASNESVDELRQEIAKLRERMQVLETIVTDQGYEVKQELHSLTS